MVSSAEILSVSTGLTWSVSALIAVLCWNCRRSRCTTLKLCGVEMVRDVMTAEELEHDAAPTTAPMNVPTEHRRSHDSHGVNPLWLGRNRASHESDNSDNFHSVECADVERRGSRANNTTPALPAIESSQDDLGR